MTKETSVIFSVENENIKNDKQASIARIESFYDDNEMDDVDEVDGENRSLVPGIDDGFLLPKNNNKPGTRIPAGYFPQWPTSYPDLPPGSDAMPSLNLYQQKRTIAQGMLDLALLSSNANQLRYVLDYKERCITSCHYFYVSLALVSLSLVLQILVAIALVFKSRYNIDVENEYRNADRINNFITMGILFITIINVFTNAFGIAPTA